MKKKISLLFIILLSGCSPKKIDTAFFYTYVNSIAIIEEYGYECLDHYFEIDSEKVDLFCKTTDYLGIITGITYNYTCIEVPIYETVPALQKDINHLKCWYKKYGKKMTKVDADLMVSKWYEKHKTIQSNQDSVITEWNKLKKREYYTMD